MAAGTGERGQPCSKAENGCRDGGREGNLVQKLNHHDRCSNQFKVALMWY